MGISFKSNNRKLKVKIKDKKEKQKINSENNQADKNILPDILSDKKEITKQEITITSLFQDFFDKVSNEYNVVEISVYTCNCNGYIYNFEKLYGKDIHSLITLERYFSVGGTTIFTGATGLAGARNFKSRYVTNVKTVNENYLIILSSRAFETFTNRFVADNITSLINEAVRKAEKL